MKYTYILLLLCNITILPPLGAYQCIISISQPCSLSVAFLRMMRERGDFLISHVPGLRAFQLLDNPRTAHAHLYLYNEPKTFSEVEQYIISLKNKGNCFIKEECYSAMHYLYKSSLVQDPDTFIVFLVRDPHHVLLSIYNKVKTTVPGNKWCVVDYQNMWNLFEHIASVHRIPLIIQMEDLTKNPEKIVRQFCDYAHIPFKKESLHWKNLWNNFTGNKINWYDTPYAQFSKIWHGNALKSTGFYHDEKQYKVDESGVPTFEEIKDVKLRAYYLKLYHEMLPYYNLFLEQYHMQQKTYATENN